MLMTAQLALRVIPQPNLALWQVYSQTVYTRFRLSDNLKILV